MTEDVRQSPVRESELKPSSLDFPVVGIGASAGGVPALQAFFRALPADCGMAFVVVLHLSPKHASDLVGILQTATTLDVSAPQEPTPIERNKVYVIAPDKTLTLDEGHLGVAALDRPRGRQVTVDLLFRSLAIAHGGRAFAIVLSGNGSDGADGITRVKEEGGVTFAQVPEEAEFDGMPRAAIATGAVDWVLPVLDMPRKLLDIWANARAMELPSAPEVGLRDMRFAQLHQRLAAEYAPPSVLIDGEGNIVHSSGQASRFLRHAAGAPSRQLLDLVHPELRLELRSAIVEATRSRKSVEVRCMRVVGEGRDRCVTMIVRPVQEPDMPSQLAMVLFDEVDETGSTARGLTGTKPTAAERDAPLEPEASGRAQAQAASNMKDEFLAIVAHELKNPLNLIQLNAELLMRLPEARNVPAVAKAAETIRRTVMSQAQIIDDLQDISRMNTGKLSLHRSPMDWTVTVKTIAGALEEEAARKKVSLSIDVPDSPVNIDADPVRIEQVVWNLLTNALKFTPAGGRIDVILRTRDTHAELEVHDTGRGIVPEALPHIFDMFKQGEPRAHRHGGMGIGLALVRSLAEAHGGRVQARSPGLDEGSTFTLDLPLLGHPPLQASGAAIENGGLASRRAPSQPGSAPTLARRSGSTS